MPPETAGAGAILGSLPGSIILGGLIEVEAQDEEATLRRAEVRQLLGRGVALAFTRVGDDAGFEEAAALLGRVAEMVSGGAGQWRAVS